MKETINGRMKEHLWLKEASILIDIIKGFRSYFKGLILAPVAPRHVMSGEDFLCGKRLEKSAARGAWCSQNSLEIGPESLY